MLMAKHPLSPFLPKTIITVRAARASLTVLRAQRSHFSFPQMIKW